MSDLSENAGTMLSSAELKKWSQNLSWLFQMIKYGPNYKKWPEQVITLSAQEMVSKLVLALSYDKIWTHRVATMSNYKEWPERVITLSAQEMVSKLVLTLSNDKKWTNRVTTMSNYKKWPERVITL